MDVLVKHKTPFIVAQAAVCETRLPKLPEPETMNQSL